ncbi:HPr family phosphocarrier protein [Acidaminobacter sp. JC074]|uniref:HPr family phosphocarrier protein n=1 Tax=Acidaminobacter sp. JC074 TaxID=2530199 RepID=UPI001F0E6490|nr:HPr family phosphocarrier protein [Acidaminobacter sp. JC074]MCH4887242.1 HPr family phosphocarrier protein [Acidaminobacter sp. JC074]
MKKVTVRVEGSSGLHARPASLLVAKAQAFESEVFIEKDGREINGKSIIGILGLGVVKGDQIVVACDGPDEEDAAEALRRLIEEDLKNE